MFTTNHIILLISSIVIIVTYLLIQKKFNFSYRTKLIALFCVGIVSEIVKIMVNMVPIVGNSFETSGTYLTQESLPFHLCSIQLFFVIFLLFFIKQETTKQILLEFMFPTMCLGASISLFVPTEGVAFNDPQVYQYFIYHAYIIAFAIDLVMSNIIRVSWKTLIRNICLLFGFSILAIYLNSMFQDHATNFMFVARPPLEGMPILNLKHGWYDYYVKLVILAVIALTIFHTPFILTQKNRDAKLNK